MLLVVLYFRLKKSPINKGSAECHSNTGDSSATVNKSVTSTDTADNQTKLKTTVTIALMHNDEWRHSTVTWSVRRSWSTTSTASRRTGVIVGAERAVLLALSSAPRAGTIIGRSAAVQLTSICYSCLAVDDATLILTSLVQVVVFSRQHGLHSTDVVDGTAKNVQLTGRTTASARSNIIGQS